MNIKTTGVSIPALHACGGGAVCRRANIDARDVGERVCPSAFGRPTSQCADRDERPSRARVSVDPLRRTSRGMVLAAFRRGGVSLQHIRQAVSIIERESDSTTPSLRGVSSPMAQSSSTTTPRLSATRSSGG